MPQVLSKYIMIYLQLSLKKYSMCRGWGSFPGGSVVKNPAANAGTMGLIPDLGRSHMARSNEACVLQLLGLSSRARELRQLKHMLCSERSHCNESPRITTREEPSLATTKKKKKKKYSLCVGGGAESQEISLPFRSYSRNWMVELHVESRNVST